jgi:hypothetical protein
MADTAGDYLAECKNPRGRLLPDGDFLDAHVGMSPSRIRRAVCDGKDVLKQGLIKRIGAGGGTSVWNSNWIPRDGFLRPVTCLMDDPPQLVSDLIDVHNAAWDEEKLNQFFLPMDKELIKNIPLTTRRQADFWAWHYERSGVFSVRSAYMMLVDTRERRTDWLDEREGSSSKKREEKEWSAIWKVKVPSKIRVFLWRLARKSLPTTDVLHHQNMAQQSTCAICS